MRELLLGITIIFLAGIGGFLYQNAVNPPSGQIACSLDARICPNGTSVGRVPPQCEFAMCPSDAITFIEPEGFNNSLPLLSSIVKGRIGFFTKEPQLLSNSITIFAFHLTDETFEEAVVSNVVFGPSDLRPQSLEEFDLVRIGDRDVHQLVTERFEATVEVVYAVPLEDFAVLVFLRDLEVLNWMDDSFTLNDLEDRVIVEGLVESISR